MSHGKISYESVLRDGLSSVRARVQKKLDETDFTDFAQMKASYFYKAILIVIDAVEVFANRFSILAAEQPQTGAGQVKLLQKAVRLRIRVIRTAPQVCLSRYQSFVLKKL